MSARTFRRRTIAGGVATGLGACLLTVGLAVPAVAAESPYVTVAWRYDGYPDLTAPQPFVASTPGANLHAFDSYLGSPEYCGPAYQIDVYRVTLEKGVSWLTLKESGALQYAHDGAFLAYDAVDGAPYRVITPEENRCAPTTTPSSTPTAPESTGGPSETPTASASTPSETEEPTAPPTTTPPTEVPTSTPTSSPTDTSSPTSTSSPTNSLTQAPSSTPSSSSAASVPSSSSPTSRTTSSSTDQLAYTGTNLWGGAALAGLLLILGGIATLISRRVRRG